MPAPDPLSPLARAREARIEHEVRIAEAFLDSGGTAANIPKRFAAAQVHATLALVAAVRQQTASRRR